MLSETQYKILQEYDNQMRTSQVNYVRGLYTKDVERLSTIYSELGYKLSNKNCSSCVLGMCKVLSNLYFEYTQNTNLKPKTVTKKTKNKK